MKSPGKLHLGPDNPLSAKSIHSRAQHRQRKNSIDPLCSRPLNELWLCEKLTSSLDYWHVSGLYEDPGPDSSFGMVSPLHDGASPSGTGPAELLTDLEASAVAFQRHCKGLALQVGSPPMKIVEFLLRDMRHPSSEIEHPIGTQTLEQSAVDHLDALTLAAQNDNVPEDASSLFPSTGKFVMMVSCSQPHSQEAKH